LNFLRALFGKPSEAKAKAVVPVEVAPDPALAALAEIELKRLRQALAAATPPPPPAPEPVAAEPAARPSRVVKVKAPATSAPGQGPAVSIWDLEDAEARAEEAAKAAAAPKVEPERRKPTRTKTRILGFEAQPNSVVPLFEETATSAIPDAAPVKGSGYVMYPTGWLIVKDGPGRGAGYPVTQGISQIGRGTDQTISLDFGDMSISRSNHAAIAYDPATHQFHVGHGGKSNLVRLNGKPLLSTEPVVDGDEIQIGETTLLLKVLCTAAFNWSAAQAGGDGHDMAIA
jgi:pSer/pThr/pTyr-binding forkhead associated (FHA) protein